MMLIVVVVAIVLKTFAGDIVSWENDGDDNVDGVITIVVAADLIVIDHYQYKNDMVEMEVVVVVGVVVAVVVYAFFDLPNTFRADFPIWFRYLPLYVQL